MRLLRRSARVTLLALASLAVAASGALAGHVPGALPLAPFSNHSHESFVNVVFPPGDYSGIDFSGAEIVNCTFAPGTNLSHALFRGANLTNTSLTGCTLDDADFRGADLSFTTLGCASFADFRGAILNGAFGTCPSPFPGSNLRDVCTVGDVPQLALASATFRGITSGVVFHDTNANGQLDLGEPGLPGVVVQVFDGIVNWLVTDSRGAYRQFETQQVPASATVGSLPPGYVLSSANAWNFNLANCRSGQGRNFSAITPATPTVNSSFGRLKLLYR